GPSAAAPPVPPVEEVPAPVAGPKVRETVQTTLGFLYRVMAFIFRRKGANPRRDRLGASGP
ncbi:MAG: hypothetical protein ACRECR_03715, partial [Thermoplasmata archaeon]